MPLIMKNNKHRRGKSYSLWGRKWKVGYEVFRGKKYKTWGKPNSTFSNWVDIENGSHEIREISPVLWNLTCIKLKQQSPTLIQFHLHAGVTYPITNWYSSISIFNTLQVYQTINCNYTFTFTWRSNNPNEPLL